MTLNDPARLTWAVYCMPTLARPLEPAEILVDFEQIAGVENQTLRVFVGKLSDVHLIGPHNDLGDRFDSLRSPG
jgi:hypothetical protein